MLHVILFRPEIPPNTGNLIRLCANAGATLHLVHPLGFDLSDDAELVFVAAPLQAEVGESDSAHHAQRHAAVEQYGSMAGWSVIGRVSLWERVGRSRSVSRRNGRRLIPGVSVVRAAVGGSQRNFFDIDRNLEVDLQGVEILQVDEIPADAVAKLHDRYMTVYGQR
mgnify:CR=1 FL=1